MFQRLKGAIDSRIAEEQARQRLSQASPTRSASNARRPAARDESPATRSTRTGARGRRDGETPGRGPDPAEFEPEFVIGEDDAPTRVGTPMPAEQKRQIPSESGNDGTLDGSESPAQERAASREVPTSDLPTDVRVKLRKLDKLESKYHELLRSYRIAHARVQTIESFETSLRENTPLTSISDPSALVEYLNNINLKGDMVLDELKRVSSDRDSFKQKFAEAEKKAKEAWDEVASLHNSEANGTPKDVAKSVPAPEEAQPKEIVNGDPLGVSSQSPTTSTKSRKGSLASLSIFSPKTKPLESPVLEKKSEDLFSFDNELPRLEAEIKEKQATIEGLEGEVNALRGDLAVTRESTQSMAGSLEKSTRELNILRERKDQLESELKEQASNSQKEIKQVKADLQTVECQLHDLKTETQSRDTAMVESLTKQLDEAKTEIKRLATRPTSEDHDFRAKELQARVEDLEAKITNLHADARLSEKRVETLNGLVSNLRGQLQSSDEASNQIQNDCRNRIAQYEAKLVNAHVNGITVADDKPLISDKSGIPQVVEPTVEPNAASKKRNKKKKKGGKSTVDSSAEDPPGGTVDKQSDDGAKELREIKESAVSNDAFVRVQNELDQLRLILAEKDAAIEKIQRKLKDQDDLKEEIESLRDDLVTVGQEHVEAKDRAKDLLAEKKALQSTIADLEMQLAELKSTHTSITAGSEAKHNELVEQFEDLKRKASSLQTDLSAAEQLANTRFKDITELKSILQKAQPELASLRAESAELRNVRESLNQKIYEIRRLDDRQEEMQLDLTKLKRAENELEKENKALNEKIAQESTGRLKAEEAGSNLTQQVHDLTVEKRHATESIDRLSRELAKAKEELRMSRTRLQDLEQQLSKTRAENEGFKEETELKTAQYASAQSLMTSMRDQTTEMATQMKEARERCESLDEEVAEAHKLLSERTREAETMRRLLADVEGRADARTREMKERMDTAIEERDRAEDEASTAGRRRAREMEEMRNKVREVERNLKRVEDEKEELESAQRDWKRRREDLEYRSDQSTKEVEAVRKAMSELRDALDESEKQVRDAEKQKAELKRAVEETQQRLEKLQKSNKSMADDVRTLQTARTRVADSEAQSSRTSMDSGPTGSRLGSPAPKSRATAGTMKESVNGQAPVSMDYVYLKNVLLQFLEQKDKKHQMQLVPVLGMLLHFDRKDEQKLMSAISTK